MSISIEEKRKALADHCEKQTMCGYCIFEDHDANWCNDYNSVTAPDEVIERAYEVLHPSGTCIEETEPITITHDVVNHPDHYCREGAMECIDEMITLFGKEAVKHFCLCNAWKYRYRSNQKNGEEDIKKSDWYIRKYRELCE